MSAWGRFEVTTEHFNPVRVDEALIRDKHEKILNCKGHRFEPHTRMCRCGLTDLDVLSKACIHAFGRNGKCTKCGASIQELLDG